jgi:hypothetical protein
LSFSSDGGQTWTRTVFATGTGPGGDGRPAACCDPTLSWDNFGNLFVGNLQRTPRTIELFVTSDMGANFTNLGPVDTGAAGTLDQPTVVAAENAVWVTWRDDSGGISARGRGVTGALTFGAWGAEQDVSTVGNFGDIAIGPTGEVMVVYQTPTGNEGPSNILIHADADGLGAGGFGAGVTVGSTNVGGFDFLPAQPQRSVDAETGLAWDRTGGANDDRVYLVYTDETPAESNDFDIFVRTSDDDGANWSAPTQVNDDAGTNSQMLPRIALDQTNGDVAVTFYDARGDTGGGPSATDIDGTANNDVTLFATWSLDAGATWAAFSDPGWNDTYTGSVDWGFGPAEAVAANVTTAGSPGVPDSGTIAATHTYLDDGAFTVTGSVTDDDGGTGSGAAGLTVNNVAPSALIDETGAVLINGVPTIITNAGSPVDFSATSADPGSDDLTLTWDWDDGPPAPDVTVVSLHAPPNPDPDPSPDGSPRLVTDNQTHTFGEACFYDVTFTSGDDDGGTGADDIAVVNVGNFPDTRSHGYFKNEIRKLRDHTAAGVQCLLDITGFMSQVFHEVRDASTPQAATAVFDKSGSSLATDIFDVQLLAAWMNFADGRVVLTDLVDTNFNGVPDTTFSNLMAEAEAVRLNPAATRAQILAQKARLESLNVSGI